MKIIAFASTALFLFTPLAFAQDVQDSKTFVMKAAVSDRFEIESGQLAAEKAQNAEVKQFAQQMVADHNKASATLKQTNNNAFPLPADLDADHKGKLEKLQQAPAAQFDKLYIDLQVEGHKQAVDLFTGYSKSGDDKNLQMFASQTLLVIQAHYDHIQKIAANM